MTEMHVVAEWARISKDPNAGAVYRVFAASTGIRHHAESYSADALSLHGEVRPGDPPWLTFGSLVSAVPEPLISITVHDPSEKHDAVGRPIWPLRLFLLRYREAAAAGASYQRLWDAIRDVRPPAIDRAPLLLRIRRQPIDELVRTVEDYGLERMTATAAMLLEGPVVLAEPVTLYRGDHLAVMDAVFALLPYGFRTVKSASTAAKNTMLHHIDLAFANAPNEQTLVPLEGSAPVPSPQTEQARDYARVLRETISAIGTRAVIEHLWAANESRSVRGTDYALAVLRELRRVRGTQPESQREHREELSEQAQLEHREATTRAQLERELRDPEWNVQLEHRKAQLERELEEARWSLQRDHKEAEASAQLKLLSATRAAIRQDAADAAAIAAEAAAYDQVLFAASYPGVLRLGVSHSLYVHVYRNGIRDQVEARLAELADQIAPHPRRSFVRANSIIARGTKLEIQPLIANVRCHPPRRTITWSGKLKEAVFRIECADPTSTGGSYSGSVLVSADGLLIAQIPISLAISTGPADLGPQLETVPASMIRRVFGSYAHEDVDLVARFRAAYRALGIHLFVDMLDIPAGEEWKRYLERQIARSDLFQLFWSYASAASPAVEHEWCYALTVADNLPTATCFIRPVYWSKPFPDPPERLAGTQFWYFDPGTFGLGARGADSSRRVKTSLIRRLLMTAGSLPRR